MVKVVKLVDSINLEQENKEYESAEVIFDSNNSNTSNCLDLKEVSTENLTKVRLTVIL